MEFFVTFIRRLEDIPFLREFLPELNLMYQHRDPSSRPYEALLELSQITHLLHSEEAGVLVAHNLDEVLDLLVYLCLG